MITDNDKYELYAYFSALPNERQDRIMGIMGILSDAVNTAPKDGHIALALLATELFTNGQEEIVIGAH